MSMTVSVEHITKTPGVLGGRPRIAGRRIAVDLIVRLHAQQGAPIEELMEMYDLTPAQIHAALAYYYDHRAEIEAILAEQDRIESEHWNDAYSKEVREQVEAELYTRYGGDPDDHLTAVEIARIYAVSVQAIRKAAAAGWVPARKSGATWLIRRGDAEARWGRKT